MKRIVLFGFLALCAAGLVSAQMGPGGMGGRGYPPSRPFPQVPAAEQTTVSGNLGIVHGRIALVGGDTIYYVGGLNRFVGFIEGLKEGARVSLEGAAYQLPNDREAKILWVSKLTLNGKDYDLSPSRADGFTPWGFPPRDRYDRSHNRNRYR
jgi:hypothetical protein